MGFNDLGTPAKVGVIVGACCIGIIILGIIGGMVSPDKNTTHNITTNISNDTTDLQFPSEFEMGTQNKVTNNGTNWYYTTKTEPNTVFEVTQVINKSMSKKFFVDGDGQEITNKKNNIYSFVDTENEYVGASELLKIDGKYYTVDVYVNAYGKMNTFKGNGEVYREHIEEFNKLNGFERGDPSNW